MIKITCTNCGKQLEAPEGAAGKKGKCPGCEEVFNVPGIADGNIIDEDEEKTSVNENIRFPSLKSISIFFVISAWVHFSAAVLLFIVVLVHMPAEVKIAGLLSIPQAALAIPILFLGIIAFVIYYALAEIIMVILDIELNTRIAAGASEETLETLKNISLQVNEKEWGDKDA